MPSSGLTVTPSVRKQASSNTRSSLAPAGSTLGSPVGSGNPRFFSVIFSIFFFFLLSERDMRGHRAIVKYRFVCLVIICRHSGCTYSSDAACTEISQIGAIRNAGSKPTHCSHLTKQNFVASQTNQFANLVEGLRLAPVKAETRQKRNSYELPIGEWPFGSTQSGCCAPQSCPC